MQVSASIYQRDEKGAYLMMYVPTSALDNIRVIDGVMSGELRLDSGRFITADQRKKIYATIADFSMFFGYPPEEMKEVMKYQFMATTGIDYFSLGNCCVTVASTFISYLLDFALEWGVPLSEPLVDRCEDIEKAVYSSLMHNRCVVCGQPGEVHHWDAIGMGRDRGNVDDSHLRKICLCRKHHNEVHNTGRDSFEHRYHVYGIVFSPDGQK